MMEAPDTASAGKARILTWILRVPGEPGAGGLGTLNLIFPDNFGPFFGSKVPQKRGK